LSPMQLRRCVVWPAAVQQQGDAIGCGCIWAAVRRQVLYTQIKRTDWFPKMEQNACVFDPNPTAKQLYDVVADKIMSMEKLLDTAQDRTSLERCFYVMQLSGLVLRLSHLLREAGCEMKSPVGVVDIDGMQYNMMENRPLASESCLRTLRMLVFSCVANGLGEACSHVIWTTSVTVQALARKRCTPVFMLVEQDEPAPLLDKLTRSCAGYLHGTETAGCIREANGFYREESQDSYAEHTEFVAAAGSEHTAEKHMTRDSFCMLLYTTLLEDDYTKSRFVLCRDNEDNICVVEAGACARLVVSVIRCESDAADVWNTIRTARVKRIYKPRRILVLGWSETKAAIQSYKLF
jgi:hypothetical protein